jgi:hypothetical protein
LILFGTLAAFSKESGLLFYAGAAVVWWLVCLRRERRWNTATLRTTVLLAIPGALFIGFLLLPQGVPMYLASGTLVTKGYLHPFDLWNRQLLDYGVLIGILDYQWVIGLGLCAALVLAARRGALRGSIDGSLTRQARRLLWSVVLGLALVTSYRTFGNARYFVMILPLVPLAMLVLARAAMIPPRYTHGLLALWLGLLVSAWHSSSDPVMSRVAGRFRTGSAMMYDMTHVSRECCGRGRDQLLYNLQYVDFSRAMDSAMVRIRAARGVTVAMSRYGHWHWVTPVDSATSLRTLRGGVDVPIVYTESLVAGEDSPEHAWLIEPPIVPPSRDALAVRYDVRDAGTVSSGGVTLRLAELVKRPGVIP